MLSEGLIHMVLLYDKRIEIGMIVTFYKNRKGTPTRASV
jgi:hypothetical protein